MFAHLCVNGPTVVEGPSDGLVPRKLPLSCDTETSFCSEVDGLIFIIWKEGWAFAISSTFMDKSFALEYSAFYVGLVAGEAE